MYFSLSSRDVMKNQYSRAAVVGYSLFLIAISALMTVLFYHIFIFKSFSSAGERAATFIEFTAEQAKNSPIPFEGNSIVEVMSYGCHYCAANEENVAKMVKNLPEGTQFAVIHLSKEGSFLASYASVFATLEEMGIEKQWRDAIYNSVITRGLNLADDAVLEDWLVKNGISVEKYMAARQSQGAKNRLNGMSAITEYYKINATPSFIVNKRYLLTQEGTFAEFAEKLTKLMQKDEQNP